MKRKFFKEASKGRNQTKGEFDKRNTCNWEESDEDREGEDALFQRHSSFAIRSRGIDKKRMKSCSERRENKHIKFVLMFGWVSMTHQGTIESIQSDGETQQSANQIIVFERKFKMGKWIVICRKQLGVCWLAVDFYIFHYFLCWWMMKGM